MKHTSTILLITWTVIMGVLFFTPGSLYKGFMFFQGEDKLAHFGLFFGWSFLLSLRGSYLKIADLKLNLVILFTACILGILTEVIQGFIPNRSSDLYDILADMIGAIAGVVIALTAKKADIFRENINN